MARTILLVDDRPQVCNTIKTSLEKEDSRIIMVATTAAGWNMILSEKPEILILGMHLPNTFEMLEQPLPELPQPWPAVIALQPPNSYVQDPRRYSRIDVDLPAPYHEVPAFVKRIFHYNDTEIARENGGGADNPGSR